MSGVMRLIGWILTLNLLDCTHIPHMECCYSAVCGEGDPKRGPCTQADCDNEDRSGESWCRDTMVCDASTNWQCMCPNSGVFSGVFGVPRGSCYISCGYSCPVEGNWPCLPGSSCTGGVCGCANGYSCTGGHGPEGCEDIDECASSPCLNGGICREPSIDLYKCSCPTGYTGDRCEIDINECNPDPCNGGTCSEGPPGTYVCDCTPTPGFEGPNCNVPINECISGPCANGGVCNDLNMGYICDCTTALGWSGTHCEVNDNECASGPCSNGGQCIDSINGYTCDCTLALGFEGTHCELPINECASGPCSNGGLCIDGVLGYTCDCSTALGWTGFHCEYEINECESGPCSNGGICNDLVNSYTCTCSPGWTGTHCEENIDECLSGPCSNNATCHDGINGYTCECLEGWTSTHCEVEIDECESGPCSNEGTCMDTVAGYYCTCTEHYTGRHCEIPICTITDGEKARRILMLVIQTMSCATILIMMGVLMGVFYVLNEWRFFRIIHLIEELTLFVGHLLILFNRTPPILGINFVCPDDNQPPTLETSDCNFVAFALHWIFTAHFLFFLIEGLNSYMFGTFVSIWMPFLRGKGILVLIFVFVPSLIVFPTAYFHYGTYSSLITCWLNFDSKNPLGEIVPATLFAWTAVILAESTNIREFHAHPEADEIQARNGQISAYGVLNCAPLSYIAWLIGMLAVHNIDLFLYSLASAFNMAAAVAIVFWHTASNDRARRIVMKLFLFLCKDWCRGCCDCPQPLPAPEPIDEYPSDDEELPLIMPITDQPILIQEMSWKDLYKWVSDGREDNRNTGEADNILFKPEITETDEIDKDEQAMENENV